MVGARATDAQNARAIADDLRDCTAHATAMVDVVIAIAPLRHINVVRPHALQVCLTLMVIGKNLLHHLRRAGPGLDLLGGSLHDAPSNTISISYNLHGNPKMQDGAEEKPMQTKNNASHHTPMACRGGHPATIRNPRSRWGGGVVAGRSLRRLIHFAFLVF